MVPGAAVCLSRGRGVRRESRPVRGSWSVGGPLVRGLGSAAEAVWPGRRTTAAATAETAETAEWESRTSSISPGERFSPPRTITSSRRPCTKRVPVRVEAAAVSGGEPPVGHVPRAAQVLACDPLTACCPDPLAGLAGLASRDRLARRVADRHLDHAENGVLMVVGSTS
jgi:hypothetical protein